MEGWRARRSARRAEKEAAVKEGALVFIAIVLLAIASDLTAIRHDLDVMAHVTDGGTE